MKKSKIIMIIGALLLLPLFVLPLWNITLEAPQYPDSIGMDIYITRFKDAAPNDIKNINIMNHYVGMENIPDTIPEFNIFYKVVIAMVVLGLIAGLIGKRRLYMAWFIIMIVLGSVGMYDFYSWEYDYGHNLKENAPIKFKKKNGEPMAYQPPLIGSKMILNFKAISMPRSGAYLMFVGMGLAVVAFVMAKKEEENA
ncbi:MAG: copper chaperone NosL [Roseivirga sp.]|jgi:copper chaperone NosL